MTTTTMMHAASRNLQTAAAELSRLQIQGSTLNKITRPSDDPAATADALKVRAAQTANTQFTRNAADGNEWLTTVDSSLETVSGLLRKAADLTLQGANDGSMSPAAKEAIAKELETIRDSLLSAANTEYLGRSVFAGNSDAGHAFAADYSYTGGAGTVERRIDDTTTVRVDADGAAVFGTGSDSVFAEIDSIVSDLRAGVNVGAHVNVLNSRSDTVSAQLAVTGARQATIIDAQKTLLSTKVDLETQRTGIEDVDIADIVLQLKTQETVYQAALSVTSRTLQPTLMDFLR
ncbi:flagellar hook-associated protein FlgL [Glaciihabitans sp. dw_435]|uniref:flagellar hook-associated protein FlgL n=1 Tax=Glaciihabitans sp. dw_435 TaxID=2720081 RepID=UPI0027DCB121|nr:flagellar hook-associated protein FlgL [Glaciihabitans sp. dw_435]